MLLDKINDLLLFCLYFRNYLFIYVFCWLLCIVIIFVIITTKWFYLQFFIFIAPEDNIALTSDFPRLTLLIRPVGLESLSLLETSAYDIFSYSVLGCSGQGSQKEEKEEEVRRLWSIITAFLQTSDVLKCHVTWYMLDNHYYWPLW